MHERKIAITLDDPKQVAGWNRRAVFPSAIVRSDLSNRLTKLYAQLGTVDKNYDSAAVAEAIFAIAKGPVAWRWRYTRPDAKWTLRATPVETREEDVNGFGVECEPLYRAGDGR